MFNVKAIKPFICINTMVRGLVRNCECQYCKCLTLNVKDKVLASAIYRQTE